MKTKGFTLIELLIVITILSVLTGVILVNLRGARESAHIAKGKNFNRGVFETLSSDNLSHWSLEGGLAQDTVSGNNGTVIGASPAEGIKDQALLFDGIGDLVEFSSPFFDNVPEEFTVSLWAKPANVPSVDAVIFYHANKGEFQLGYSSAEKFYFSYNLENSGWTGIESNHKSPPEAWYNVVATWSQPKQEAFIYVNGSFAGSMALPNEKMKSPIGNPSLAAFKRPGGTSNYFNGTLDEISLYEKSFR